MTPLASSKYLQICEIPRASELEIEKRERERERDRDRKRDK